MPWMFGSRLAVLSLVTAPLAAQTTPSISPEAIGRHVTRLAADSMLGRATPSRGLDRAARYAAGIFQSAGLVPLGDSGTFLQRYRILTTRIVPESSSVRLIGPPGASSTWRLGREVDWLPVGDLSPGVVSGPALVLTGLPADSARPFGALDARGAIVIHFARMTEEGGPEAPAWLFQAAARAGVVGWIQVVQYDSTRWTNAVVARVRRPRTFVSGSREVAPFPTVEMRDEAISGPLLEAGFETAGLRPFPVPLPAAQWLPGYTIRLRLVERVVTRRAAPNVLALLPGTDTTGRGTLLVLAHLDGLGVGNPVGRDSIYNGADDNASGVAAVLEAAKTLARGPRPARDIVFALFSGTERQLAGAEYYLAHPVVPRGEVIGVINVEAIGHAHKDSLVVIRGPAPTPLEAAVERTARAHATALGLTVVGDLHRQARLWLEGDHSLFFGLGLPILYLYNGPHPKLHKPADDAGTIAFPQTARIAQFLALLSHAAATPIP